MEGPVQTVELLGSQVMLVPHLPYETAVLNRLGYPIPAPILSHYNFPSPEGEQAFDAQKQTAALLSQSPRAYVLNELGTGKTRAITHRIAYGVRAGILPPASVLAVTFTNRAAGEMRGRLRQLCAGGQVSLASGLQRPEGEVGPDPAGGPVGRFDVGAGVPAVAHGAQVQHRRPGRGSDVVGELLAPALDANGDRSRQ